jgi:hypothetical protein
MKTITVEYELYDVHELEEQFPDGFRKAREQMVADLWEVWGTEAVSDTMRMVADDAGCPFTTRFLEWDLYRGEIGYVGGPLDHKEWTALVEWEPELAGHEDLALIVRYGLIQQSEDYARDDEAEPMIDGINERLRDLYGEMMGAGRQEELYLESEEYFREHCEANEYTFEANGRMRNA